jgi:translation initiation factor IF-3
MNKQIKAKEIRLIGDEGNQIGVVSLREAMEAAEQAELDLVEINPTSKPPVCKLMDYGKHRYEQSKKERESRLKRKIIEIKEVKMRPKIDSHDYDTKKRLAEKFLKDGDKVKITLMFRGREMMYRSKGIEMLNTFYQTLAETAVQEKLPKMEGRNMTMILAPKNTGG